MDRRGSEERERNAEHETRTHRVELETASSRNSLNCQHVDVILPRVLLYTRITQPIEVASVNDPRVRYNNRGYRFRTSPLVFFYLTHVFTLAPSYRGQVDAKRSLLTRVFAHSSMLRHYSIFYITNGIAERPPRV